jgi:hypothetical protein
MASYSEKNLKFTKSRHKSLIYKDLRQKRPPFGAVSRFGVSVYVIFNEKRSWLTYGWVFYLQRGKVPVCVKKPGWSKRNPLKSQRCITQSTPLAPKPHNSPSLTPHQRTTQTTPLAPLIRPPKLQALQPQTQN